MKPITLALASLVALGSCSDDADSRIELGPTFDCHGRPEDVTGYLQPICRYVADVLGRYEIDPNTLAIELVTPGDQVPGAMPPTNTAEFDHVRLSCCFTGDHAVMRRATHEVVAFMLGDQ